MNCTGKPLKINNSFLCGNILQTILQTKACGIPYFTTPATWSLVKNKLNSYLEELVIELNIELILGTKG